MIGKFTLVKNVKDSSDLHGTSETTQEMNMVVRKNALFTKKTGVDLEIPAGKNMYLAQVIIHIHVIHANKCFKA